MDRYRRWNGIRRGSVRGGVMPRYLLRPCPALCCQQGEGVDAPAWKVKQKVRRSWPTPPFHFLHQDFLGWGIVL